VTYYKYCHTRLFAGVQISEVGAVSHNLYQLHVVHILSNRMPAGSPDDRVRYAAVSERSALYQKELAATCVGERSDRQPAVFRVRLLRRRHLHDGRLRRRLRRHLSRSTHKYCVGECSGCYHGAACMDNTRPLTSRRVIGAITFRYMGPIPPSLLCPFLRLLIPRNPPTLPCFPCPSFPFLHLEVGPQIQRCGERCKLPSGYGEEP